ncbi:MAG: glycerol-3-phosphate 1-O-acyltransferase PlsY [Rubrivivax sp.]
MQTMLASAIAVALGYLVGSLSFAVIVSRAVGLADPRSYGSGNPGATNVLRSGHKGAALLTLALDALKGFVPVLLASLWGPRFGLSETTVALVGLAAFVGHLWPVFFHFRGGKGVATAAGVLVGLNPWLGLAVLAVWLAVAALLRYSSLASIAAALAAPLLQLLIWGAEPAIAAIAPMCVLLLWRHEGNIRKLLAGTESRLGRKAAPPAPAPPATSRRKGHPR